MQKCKTKWGDSGNYSKKSLIVLLKIFIFFLNYYASFATLFIKKKCKDNFFTNCDSLLGKVCVFHQCLSMAFTFQFLHASYGSSYEYERITTSKMIGVEWINWRSTTSTSKNIQKTYKSAKTTA